MKAHVLTSTTFASPPPPPSPSPVSVQPAASSRPASSSESTSLRAHPRVTRLTVRSPGCGFSLPADTLLPDDTLADYGKPGGAGERCGSGPRRPAGTGLVGTGLAGTGLAGAGLADTGLAGTGHGRQPVAWVGSFRPGPRLSVTGWPGEPGRPRFF